MRPIEKDEIKFYQRIVYKIEIPSQLNQPAIMKYIAFSPIDFEDYNCPILIMEYCSNNSLDSMIINNKNQSFK